MPSNDNQKPDKKWSWKDYAITVFVVGLPCAIVGGIGYAWYIKEGWPLTVSIIAFIILMAG